MNRLSVLARANVLAHLATHGAGTSAVLRGLAELQALLTHDAILAPIKGDRARAGMPPPNLALLTTDIDILRDTHASALAAGALALGEGQGSRVLGDLVQSAETSLLAFLRRAAAAWGRATAHRGSDLLEMAGRQETALAVPQNPKDTKSLAELIRAWGRLTAPQRLVEARAGLSHTASSEAARRWRALGIALANERDASVAALPIAEALAAHFEALPDIGSQLMADVAECRSVAQLAAARDTPEMRALEAAIAQAERGREVLRRELTGLCPPRRGSKEVGDLLTAFVAAAASASDERPWQLVRDLALKLHNDYDMSEAALALTLMMRADLHRGRGKATPALLEALEGDWRTLRRKILVGLSETAMRGGRWSTALNLLDELVGLESYPGQQREWRETQRRVRSRIARGRAKAGVWAILVTHTCPPATRLRRLLRCRLHRPGSLHTPKLRPTMLRFRPHPVSTCFRAPN
ncbi:MAG: hypothetical protein ABI224_13400 [Acetobacteraceae bacterium]